MCQAGLIEDCSCRNMGGTPAQFPPGGPGVHVVTVTGFDSDGHTCETDPFLLPRREGKEDEEPPATRWRLGQEYWCPSLPQVRCSLPQVSSVVVSIFSVLFTLSLASRILRYHGIMLAMIMGVARTVIFRGQ